MLTNQITVTGDTAPQAIPCVAFGDNHYLVTWNQGFNPRSGTTSGTINARLFDSDGVPTTPEFTLFAPEGKQVPFFAPVLFDGTRFFSAVGMGRVVTWCSNLSFTNGIIAGALIVP